MIETVTSYNTLTETVTDVILVTENTPQVIISENEPGPQGPPGVTKISDATDVDDSNLEDGSILIYSQSNDMWVASRLLEQQAIESGHY